MSILFLSLPILLVIFAVNLLAVRGGSGARLAFNILLFLANVLLLGLGLALRFLPLEAALTESGLPLIDGDLGRLALVGMGLWGALASLSPFRRALARALPELDPDSPVHTLALAASGYLMSNALFSLEPGALEALVEGGFEANLIDVLAQQLMFVLAAFFGAGLLTRREGEALNRRLGLLRPTAGQLLAGVRWVIFLVLLQSCVGLTWSLLDPAQSGELSGVNQALLGGFDTVWEWFLLAAAAGLGEELLFRGALQPIFGILPTSLIFAVSHIQYGLTPATLAILLLSVVLGFIRKRHSTTMAIAVHAGYNFTLGLLSLLAMYLEPFARQAAL
jgi:membrane protease YdiL (CAAX protease family)